MKKIKLLSNTLIYLNLSIFLIFIFNPIFTINASNSDRFYDPYNLFDEVNPTWNSTVKTYDPLGHHAYVLNSHGKMQTNKDFKLHFFGTEDKSSTRIFSKIPYEQYTLKERLKYTFGYKLPMAVLSGTMTPHGVITNAHGFVEELPTISNKIRGILGLRQYYRTLDPVLIEQGLTSKYFDTSELDFYYNPDYENDISDYKVVHKLYTTDVVSQVSLHEDYLIQDKRMKNGWFIGKINSENDIAIIRFNEDIKIHHTTDLFSKLPIGNIRTRIYQYPQGHPLQKSSEEFANFSTSTHRCVTLGGSSGSSLRDVDTNKMFGVHAGSKRKDKYSTPFNYFIPFSEERISKINFLIYKNNNV